MRIGLSQQEFSDKIGMTRSNYSHFERGKSNLTMDTFLVLANKFNIDVDFINNDDINEANINSYLDGYLNGYLNEKIKDSSNDSELSRTTSLANNKDSHCESCKEKERIITVLNNQIEILRDQVEGLKQQTLDLRNDKIQLKEQYSNLAKDINSRKRNSA